MTTNDYDARLARLNAATKGDTVTIPDNWTRPSTRPVRMSDLRPGDVLTHDGSVDNLCWEVDPAALARLANQGRWLTHNEVATLCLDVDTADEPVDEDTDPVTAALADVPEGSTIEFTAPRDFAPGTYRLGIPDEYRITKVTRKEGGSWKLEGVRGGVESSFAGYSEQVAGLGLTADDFTPAGRSTGPTVHLEASTVYTMPAGTELPTEGTLPDGAVPIGKINGDGVALDPNRKNDECCGCPQCARLCYGCDACEPDEDDDGSATVTVRVVPDTDGFVEAVEKAARDAADAADAAGFHLDEYQRERVAALEQALRVLESRRAAKGSEPGSLAAMFGKRAEVPMVGKRDLVDVAAFIADGDTGRSEVSA